MRYQITNRNPFKSYRSSNPKSKLMLARFDAIQHPGSPKNSPESSSAAHGQPGFRIPFGTWKMASHIVGYPRMGPKRELKFALESFCDKKSSFEDSQKVAADLRSNIWKQMSAAGTKFIPSNTFSYYDQVLDTTVMLGAVPQRYGWSGGEIGFDTYFSMARGNATLPAMEMTKWFDTNYHYIVPELGPDTSFSYSSHKAVIEYKEAKALGIDPVPVLVGPVSYLLLSKPAKGVEKSFCIVSLLDKVLPVYKEVILELKVAGALWIQFDEPTLVLDLESDKLQAFTKAYSELESSLFGIDALIVSYFADVPAEAYKYQILGVFLLIELCILGAEWLRRSNLSSIASSVNQTSFGSYRSTGSEDFHIRNLAISIRKIISEVKRNFSTCIKVIINTSSLSVLKKIRY